MNPLRAVLAVCIVAVPAGAQVPRPGASDVYDGFEEPGLSKAWETSRFANGAVRIQGAVVRAGHGAAEVTVRPGDQFEAGLGGNSDSERAELMEARGLVSKERTNYEYAFSMFFPADFPIVSTRLVIAQWKQYCPEGGVCSDDSPVLAIRYMSGVLRVTQDIGKRYTVLCEEKGEFRGRWLDFRVQTRFSSGTDGKVRVWAGDRSVVNFSGVTANAANDSTGYRSPGYYYFKMGLYRNVMSAPMTVYIDEYRKRRLPEDAL